MASSLAKFIRAPRIGMQVKGLFFDRSRVIGAMDKATHRAMRAAARKVRRRAQTSMRYATDMATQQRAVDAGTRKRPAAPYTPSQPGKPPRAVRPHPWLRKNLFYYYAPAPKTALIGPVGFRTGAPHTLEFGGYTMIRNPRRTHRKVGDGGEIRINSSGAVRDASTGKFKKLGGKTTKPTVDRNGTVVMVTYALLRTIKQAYRADMLNRQLYGEAYKRVRVAPRPFMGPALEAEAPEIPKLWRNSVRG